jgi:MscS family membrane protein
VREPSPLPRRFHLTDGAPLGTIIHGREPHRRCRQFHRKAVSLVKGTSGTRPRTARSDLRIRPRALRASRAVRVTGLAVISLFFAIAIASAAPVGRAAADSTQVSRWLKEAMPSSFKQGGFSGLQYWQWLGLLIVIVVGILANYTARALLWPLFRRALRRAGLGAEDESVRRARRAIGPFVGAVVWLLLIRLLGLTGTAREVSLTVTGAYAVFTGTLAGWRLVDVLADALLRLAKRTETRVDDVVVPMVRRAIKVLLVAFGAVYCAQNLNINIIPLITGLGIGGLAVAFAAKDTIENFFGSVAVVLDRSFEVGDWIVVGDVEGIVEKLGFRSTKVRTFSNSQVTIPNASLVRANVDNYGRRTYRRWSTSVYVQYDTPPEKLVAFTEGIRELVRRHPHTRKDSFEVWCNDFGESGVKILVYVFFKAPGWSAELREREHLLVDIVRLADRLGVRFAVPARTVELFQGSARPVGSQVELPPGTAGEEARKAGSQAAREITEAQLWQTEAPGPGDSGSPGTEKQR